ncbi:MAG: YbaN family protein [Bacteroidales bacterium]|nr:YbaN family protein [Bacteroidales bacterium]MDD4671212.1 YbaN family protein [Bacteroidales bacterium]
MKVLYVILGTISLALGILGIVLPILPTTPFLLLTAFLYFKGSGRLYDKLMSDKHLGPYIKDFRENRTIPLPTKIVSISLLWITISASALFVVDILWLRILLLVVAIAVTIHITSYKTKH